MRDLVADGELQGIVLVLADEIEEPPADVDIAPRMREGTHGVGLEDREGVADVLAPAGLQERLRGFRDPALPWAGRRALVQLQDQVMELGAEAGLILGTQAGQVP